MNEQDIEILLRKCKPAEASTAAEERWRLTIDRLIDQDRSPSSGKSVWLRVALIASLAVNLVALWPDIGTVDEHAVSTVGATPVFSDPQTPAMTATSVVGWAPQTTNYTRIYP